MLICLFSLLEVWIFPIISVGNSFYKESFSPQSCPSLWFIFLNKSSCIFTKRRYLMLDEIGVIRSAINGCVSLHSCYCLKPHLSEIRFFLQREKTKASTVSWELDRTYWQLPENPPMCWWCQISGIIAWEQRWILNYNINLPGHYY